MKNSGVAASGSGRSYWLVYGSAVGVILFSGIALLMSGAGNYPELLGMGLLSFSLGLRHAFDADHISAIDNIIRKLVQQKKNPMGVGFFFACGHSTLVFVMGLATIFTVKWAQSRFPEILGYSSSIVNAVSGGFLVILAIINSIILKDILKDFLKLKRGEYDPVKLADLPSGGFISRSAKFLFGMVNNNWHVFGVGFLFGLGFDTATQIAVLATSATAASQDIPWFAVLSFPVLFTAGMGLMDTLDGFFMCTAYKWVFSSPLRKIYYNLVITGLSILAAGLIGFIKVAQSIILGIGLNDTFSVWLQELDFNVLGFILVGMFLLVWGISLAGWKLLRLGEKESGVA